jgi:hypothetical protein
MHVYEVHPRKDKRGIDLISHELPFGRMRDDTPGHAIGCAMHSSRSADAVIRVYDDAGDVIETHERSSRRTYSDCQFVSEQVNCCVRSCYRYGTRFGHLYYEIKLNSKNLCRWIKPIDVSGMLAAKANVEALRT